MLTWSIFPVGLKQRAQLGFGCAVGDVANKKLLHMFPFFVKTELRTCCKNLKYYSAPQILLAETYFSALAVAFGA